MKKSQSPLRGARPPGPILAVTFALLSGAASCSDETDGAADASSASISSSNPVMEAPMATTFAPELNIDLAQMEQSGGGLYRRDLVVGEGAFATPGDNVTVHYTGWLPDGKQFDSSRSKSPFTFPLGTQSVIDGWDQGVAGMREGGKRQLVIPPELGYGPLGAGGVIPPNATLVFEVELLSVD